MKTLVSSAYEIEINFSEALEKSLISIINKIGPRMDPCYAMSYWFGV